MEIRELLDDLGVQYRDDHRNIRAGWIGVDCPWCGSVDKFHLGISLEDGYASCWVCGYHSLPAVVAELSSLSYSQAKDRLGVLPPARSLEHPRTGRVRVPNGVGALLPAHTAYLEQRGLDGSTARFWGLMGIGVAVRLSWRIWIPIHDRGRMVSWTTRTIGRGDPKYISARPDEESTPIKSCLYGVDHCRHVTVVVEGPVDVWRIGPGAVATFGVNYTMEQVRRLAEFPVRAVAFDSEEAAQQRAVRLCDALSAYPGLTTRVILDADDPGSAGDKEIREIRERFLENTSSA